MSLVNAFMNDDPGKDAEVIVPSDTVNQGPFRMLYVGVAGNVTLVTLGGNTVLFKAVPVGLLRVGFSRVNATGTAATDMVGLT